MTATILFLALASAVPGAAQAAPLPAADAPALDCLAEAVAREAGGEPQAGQQAVAEVVLNRLRHRAYPKSLCGVVNAGSDRRTGCQFSFTCDGSRARAVAPAVLASARRIAADALAGTAPRRTAGATHYHAASVAPVWAASLIRLGRIGAHVFYRLPGAEVASAAPIVTDAAEAVPAPTPFAPWGLLPSPPPPHS